jgi:hypothetical protein
MSVQAKKYNATVFAHTIMYYVMKNVNLIVSSVMANALMVEYRIVMENAYLVPLINGCATIIVYQLRHLAMADVLKVI